VADSREDLLTRGRSALGDGDWAAARACFEAIIDRGDPAALEGLAQALFCMGDYAGAIDRSEQAFAGFRARGDDAAAAACARLVGYLYGVVYGNAAAMSGWLARAVRLIDGAGDCAERARIELTRATLTADPVTREQHLAKAVAIADRIGDPDLVFDAMSQRGLHLVAAGSVAAGMALLDEALAAVAAGEVRDLISVGAMYCKMLHACELTYDVRRAEEWLIFADRFVDRTGKIPISAICRTHYGGVLTAAGRWADAERELMTSIELYDRSFHALRGASVVRLAGLRVRQGRLAEAAELLASAEQDSHAIQPLVELHLARAEPELAVARIERFLRTHPPNDLAAPVLFLLVQAMLAQGDPEAAAAAAGRLAELARAASPALLPALMEHADGLVAAALNDASAPGHLERAVVGFARLGLPLEEARARLDLAHSLTSVHPAMATVEARAALRSFQELTATRDADAATSLLRRLGVRGHSAPRGTGALTGREHEVLTLLGQGLSNLDIAARLYVSRRTVEHHVSNILAKLGLASRAEVTVHVLRQNLNLSTPPNTT
jgi:DNA-binding CsgD family transcriptional regulator/tetratricopeptide (TPR) repeat protein